MRKAPKIGTRVSVAAYLPLHGAYTGTVHAIYPKEYWDEDNDRPMGLRPEHEWHVGVTVDEVPTPWCYTGTNKIAPEVSKLRKVMQ